MKYNGQNVKYVGIGSNGKHLFQTIEPSVSGILYQVSEVEKAAIELAAKCIGFAAFNRIVRENSERG